jgi:hypothetical protein
VRQRVRTAASAGALFLVAASWGAPEAAPRESKPVAAAEYFGHVKGKTPGFFVVHIDAYTPDDTASAVALAGHDGDANAIRAALGRLDAGFIKVGDNGYRVALARRRAEDEGVRIILIIRNELEFAGRANMKFLRIPPLAAVEIWMPLAGEGEAAIACAASVVFRSADDIAITDWGNETLRAFGLRDRTK